VPAPRFALVMPMLPGLRSLTLAGAMFGPATG